MRNPTGIPGSGGQGVEIPTFPDTEGQANTGGQARKLPPLPQIDLTKLDKLVEVKTQDVHWRCWCGVRGCAAGEGQDGIFHEWADDIKIGTVELNYRPRS